eukprot:2759279-Alexandrium_andersonii.AAC.1
MSVDELIELHQVALETGVAYLQSMGAKLAPSKSRTLSNSERVRAHFRRWVVPGLGESFGVCHTVRDLGAQLNMGRCAHSGVMHARVARACKCADYIAEIPAPFKARSRALVGKVLPMGTYGAPTTPITRADMAALRAAMTRAIDPGAAVGRAPGLALNACVTRSVDPKVHVLVQRVSALRRALVVDERMREQFTCVFDEQVTKGHMGCCGASGVTVSYTHLRAHETSAHL